jgi:excisionase family DNA binding protein
MGLLTVRAAAERMGIGYSTLKQWIHQGKVRTTRTAGGHHRLSEAEVDRVLAPQAGATGSTGSSTKCGPTDCLARSVCGSAIRR